MRVENYFNMIFKDVIRPKMELLHMNRLRKKVNNNDFSIISQNCIGGVIYHMLGMEFKSPTINMFIEGENFVKLVDRLEYYMGCDPKPLTDRFVDPINPKIVYPKILLDDIELCCLHYKACKAAIDDWNRRKARVNFDKVIVIANSWNLKNDIQNIKKVCMGKYKTICFVYGDYDETFPNCIKLEKGRFRMDDRGIVFPNLISYKRGSYKRYFEDYVDIVELINEL